MKTLHRLLLIGVGLVGVVACATRAESNDGSSESDILNGTASDRREVVLLGDKSSGCSGTLIAPDVVMTAAHCSDYRTVNVGYSKRTTSSEDAINDPGPDDTYRRYRVVERVNMPGFVNSGCPMTGASDVALLRLAEPVVDPTLATLAEHAPQIGEECVVVGYGRHNADDNLETVEDRTAQWTYGERREARVTISEKGGRGIPRADAGSADAAADDGGASDAGVAGTIDWFSAKGIDGAHSRGDSGGAIFCGGKLAGVVSCSVDRNQKILDLVKVYGNIETARPFVEETMRRWRENPLPPPAADAGTEASAPSVDASIADAAQD
jgi:hypothetical protein